MSNRRIIIDDEHYVHFVTYSVYRRRRLLDHDHAKGIVLGVLNQALQRFKAYCAGFVVMPNHVHAVVWLPALGQLSQFMHEWKRLSSLKLRKWYRQNAPHYASEFGEGEKFWQSKYYSFEIYNRAKLQEKLEYMHLNPVHAGLVQRAIDWKWSFARWYVDQKSVGVPITWVE